MLLDIHDGPAGIRTILQYFENGEDFDDGSDFALNDQYSVQMAARLFVWLAREMHAIEYGGPGSRNRFYRLDIKLCDALGP